jgi:hypothetical protein
MVTCVPTPIGVGNQWRLLGVLLLCIVCGTPVAAQNQQGAPPYQPLLDSLQQTVATGDQARFLTLLAPGADQAAATAFAREMFPTSVDRVTLRPRFQLPLSDVPADTGYEVTVELFFEADAQGRLETWQLEVVRLDEDGWGVQDQSRVDSIDGLHHLQLTATEQYTANNLVILGEDLSLTLRKGSVFVAETDAGVTGLVLLGDGEMHFAPQPEAEQGQLRIFDGDETLETKFEAAFVRLHPDVFTARVSTSALVERSVDQGDLEDATEIFNELIALSFMLDLSHISDDIWSLIPGAGDFLAEVRTEKLGTLTYAQASGQPEDVSLSNRTTGRVISLYPSARKRATQTRYFSDDDQAAVDILDFNIAASFEPLGVTQQELRAAPELIGCRIVGTTRLAMRVKGPPIKTFNLRLADDLAVSSVTSNEFGPLLFFRMNRQNILVINLPNEVPGGAEFTVDIQYAGDLRGQALDEDWIATQYFWFQAAGLSGLGEPRYVYSNRSYWYPQGAFTDYATATLQLSVPPSWGVVASGSPLESNPPVAGPEGTGPRRFGFVAVQPARYLSALVSRFEDHAVPDRKVRLTDSSGPGVWQLNGGAVYYDTLTVTGLASPRSIDEVETVVEQTADIASFYGTLLGDIPYPSMTVATTDSRQPGGHSPAYFAVMNHALPAAPGVIVSWKTDPVSFSGYPSFFLAHEVAHQWWGQAVGWKNYHEQWLSEGLAQYFAALYAEQSAGPEVFTDILKQMRQWAMRQSREGPVYLGYRLGHLDREPRVFRALVYNKGAMVLHMLRGLLGDDTFFNGLRRFYHASRFEKAGTDALQLAFELESGVPLDRFFERWIHETELPELKFSSRTETTATGDEIVLRFEQRTERLFDLPVLVDLVYRSGDEETVTIPVTDRVSEMRVPAKGRLRRARISRTDTALADIDD